MALFDPKDPTDTILMGLSLAIVIVVLAYGYVVDNWSTLSRDWNVSVEVTRSPGEVTVTGHVQHRPDGEPVTPAR